MLVKVFISPFAAYFMAMFWAAIFGDTFYLEENSMFTEWLVCVIIYFVLVILNSVRPTKSKIDYE